MLKIIVPSIAVILAAIIALYEPDPPCLNENIKSNHQENIRAFVNRAEQKMAEKEIELGSSGAVLNNSFDKISNCLAGNHKKMKALQDLNIKLDCAVHKLVAQVPETCELHLKSHTVSSISDVRGFYEIPYIDFVRNLRE